MQNRKALFILSVIGSFVFFSSLFIQHAHAAVQQQGLESLPLEGRYTISAAIGHENSDYHVRQYSGNLEANNTGQGLSMLFSAEGVTMAADAQRVSLRPMLWGYGEELSLLPEGLPQAIGNIISSSRGSVNEWYVNGPMGLQQGFTVTEKPQAGAGPLKIALALVGARAGTVDADGTGVMLNKTDGSPLYRYSGLVVRDAQGLQAEAWLEAKADTLTICVDDTGHTYPLYIDPVMQVARLTASNSNNPNSTIMSVAISGDTVVVGEFGDLDMTLNYIPGSAYVFVKPESGWSNMTQTAKLTPSDSAINDFFGISVAISGDTVVVGAYGQAIAGRNTPGSAYVFVKPESGWSNMTQTAKLTASDAFSQDCFGEHVAISGDTVVVSMRHNHSVCIFVKPESGWSNMTQTAKLTASDDAGDDYFGVSVAISGDTVVAGAPNVANQGASYVFVKPAGGWEDMTQTAKLIASDGAARDSLGASIAISGNTVVAGAPYKDIGTNANQGASYVFVKPASGWADMTQTARLTASDGAGNDYFGYNVAISGDTVVVSMLTKSSVCIFVKPASGWSNMTQSAQFWAYEYSTMFIYGYPVAISGSTVVVRPGYVYMFTISDTDGDGVYDDIDNCPAVANPQQKDGDGDGIGDMCDTTPGCGGCGQPACEGLTDRDGDYVLDINDNCPDICNYQQLDGDGDGIGDACDTGFAGCGEGCGLPACEQACAL
jgi:hypothetical protein